MSERAKIFVRVNTQKCTADELIEILARQGVGGKKIDGFPNALELVNGGAVEHLDAYKKDFSCAGSFVAALLHGARPAAGRYRI